MSTTFERQNKYNVASVLDRTVDGIRFDSKAEATRYILLCHLERAGHIRDLERQVPYVLVPKYRRADGSVCRGVTYRADFRYFDVAKGKLIVEDVKGAITEGYRIKRALLEWRYPDINFMEVRG